MSQHDTELDRLLRAAAGAGEQTAEAPFGFETRVVAQWRSARDTGSPWEIARLIRGVALGATALIAIAGAGAFWQLRENDELNDSYRDEYAIADSAIDNGALR